MTGGKYTVFLSVLVRVRPCESVVFAAVRGCSLGGLWPSQKTFWAHWTDREFRLLYLLNYLYCLYILVY